MKSHGGVLEEVAEDSGDDDHNCFFDIFNQDSDLNKKSLAHLGERMAGYDLKAVFTSHNGWTEDVKGAFAHVNTIPVISKANPFDKTAPYDCFEEQE